jgi:pyrroloquinoline quinone (PQQ) biosynthesis protein C
MKDSSRFPAFPLELSKWIFGEYFDPSTKTTLHPVIELANRYQTEAHVECHPFFQLARRNRNALRIWAAQEAVVTNTFSQLLLFVSSQIRNVHLRAEFMEVISGEHHSLKGSTAVNSHPWLLRRLCLSIGLKVEEIMPLPCTTKFLKVLSDSTDNLLTALGALAVGNERMLVPEYTAVKACFAAAWPESAYYGFLDANICEDVAHAQIAESVASSLIRSDEDAECFYRGAAAGVDARIAYYDELQEYVELEKA